MVELRQANSNDYDFLYNLKKKTLKDYVSKTWGWDERWQKNHFAKKFNPKLIIIIKKSGKEIGCFSIIEEEEYYFLSLIEILPKYQNQGIGTNIIKELLLEARKKNKLVYLHVLRVNEKAVKLYKRLGFLLEEETETHLKMVFKKVRD